MLTRVIRYMYGRYDRVLNFACIVIISMHVWLVWVYRLWCDLLWQCGLKTLIRWGTEWEEFYFHLITTKPIFSAKARYSKHQFIQCYLGNRRVGGWERKSKIDPDPYQSVLQFELAIMSTRTYFKPNDGLPNPKGPVSQPIPSQPIGLANIQVAKATRDKSKKRLPSIATSWSMW